MTYHEPTSSSAAASAAAPSFTPAALRQRHDGWTPARQVAFIQALADTACVEEACERVGMSATSAYVLRRRREAASFREAWDAALDYGVGRLADAALGRALRGVATPIFYKGEQVGERRTYNDKLTMFLLRYRDPARYGAWLDHVEVRDMHPDAPARRLAQAIARVGADAQDVRRGRKPAERAPLPRVLFADDPEVADAMAEEEERRADARDKAAQERWMETLRDEAAHAEGVSGLDVAQTS